MRLTIPWILALVVLLAYPKAAASAMLGVSAEKVIVFKDGYCMFVKRVSGVTDSSGRAVIEKVPEAMVLGTFWLIPKEGAAPVTTARKRIIPGRSQNEAEKSLLLDFGPDSAGRNVELSLIYFAPGIRWIPTYRISLGDDGRADIVMQAEIVNEAEDLADVSADLVVGVPNFRFKDVVSPLSLETTLRNALRQAAPQVMSQSYSNVLMSQRIGDIPYSSDAGGEPGVSAVPSELAGGGSQDLFIFNIPRLSLKMGERAAIPISSASVPFRHLYTWDVQLTRSGVEAVPAAGKFSSPVKLLKNEVWHQIETENATDSPWTTGAALVMDGYLPVAQELLTYTSAGAKNRLPLTVAIDIRGTYEEEEVGRDLEAIHFDGHAYVRITKKGTLSVTNYKKENVDLLITCQFGGNATKASDAGKIEVTDFKNEDWGTFRGSPALTGHSVIDWEITLKPGETKEVSCEYFYYAR